MDNTTSKEKILKRIRTALLEQHENPYPVLEDKALYITETDAHESIFTRELTAIAGEFLPCNDEADFIAKLKQLTISQGWQNIYCWEPALQQILTSSNYQFKHNDTDFENAEVGITLCDALLARNGSIMLTNGNAAGRRLSIYPGVHIVVAYRSQLVLDIKDAFNNVKRKYGDSLPTMICNITGPSRTADIEKTLVLGAHGPKELYVFLLDG